MLAFLMLSIIPLIVLAVFFLEFHRSDLEKQSIHSLSSLRDDKANALINYFDERQSEITSFARSELAKTSGGRFYGLIAAFQQLTPSEQVIPSTEQLTPSAERLIPDTKQSQFASSERYRLLHKRYDISFKDQLAHSDFDDILLVDLKGNVAYSAQKNAYMGINLREDKWRDTPLGKTFNALKEKISTQKITDELPITFSGFKPTKKGEIFAWFAAPIIQQNYLHSFILFRLPNTAFAQGLNKRPDDNPDIFTLLLGQDKKPINLIKLDLAQNTPNMTATHLTDKAGIGHFINQEKTAVLRAYTPLNVLGFNWHLTVELPEEAAFSHIFYLENVFLVVILITLFLVVLASHWLANFITAPLLKLTWIAEQVAGGELEQTICYTERKDEIGRLAQSFVRMQTSIREKIILNEKQNKELKQSLQLIQNNNQALQKADRMKDDFLATTSHKLRAPLHGMIGIAQSLQAASTKMTKAEQAKQLCLLIQSGQALSDLIDDLLDYHKMCYGHLVIHPKPIDAATAVRFAIELSEHLIGDKPVRIINQMPFDLPLIKADEQRLEQVLYHLIGNAIKYTQEGKVIISATKLEQSLRIQVIDTGQGIATEALNCIFDPLTHAKEKHERPHKGAGLGLSISRQLINIMGGQLYVSSQLMIGTTFSFTLPFADEKDTLAALQSQPQTQPQSLHFTKTRAEKDKLDIALPEASFDPSAPLILIVDDEPINLQILHNFLCLDGYQVKALTNGREAIEQVAIQKPALILLDTMMPTLSGYEVCSHLREHYSSFDLPIILLSGLEARPDKTKAFAAGANDYLTKPFNKKELSLKVQTCINAALTEQVEHKNKRLEQEILERDCIEADLKKVQSRLFDMLHFAINPILCIDKEGIIAYANEGVARLFDCNLGQLHHHHLEDFLLMPLTEQNKKHWSAPLTFCLNKEEIKVTANLFTLPSRSELHLLMVFNLEQNNAAQQLALLEKALDYLSDFALQGDKVKLQQLRELGGEFTNIADKFNTQPDTKQHRARELLVKAMTLTLNYWQENTGKSKFDLAEESGLWRVYLDRSSLQTRTLDKYLHVETVPKTPRWRTVLSSLDFVLARCEAQNAQRETLMTLKEQLLSLNNK